MPEPTRALTPLVVSYRSRALQSRGEGDQPGHPIAAVGRGAHPYGQVITDQRAGVAVVGLALGIAAARQFEIDPADGTPTNGQPGLGDVGRSGAYSAGRATTRVSTTELIVGSRTDSVEAAAKVPSIGGSAGWSSVCPTISRLGVSARIVTCR